RRDPGQVGIASVREDRRHSGADVRRLDHGGMSDEHPGHVGYGVVLARLEDPDGQADVPSPRTLLRRPGQGEEQGRGGGGQRAGGAADGAASTDGTLHGMLLSSANGGRSTDRRARVTGPPGTRQTRRTSYTMRQSSSGW